MEPLWNRITGSPRKQKSLISDPGKERLDKTKLATAEILVRIPCYLFNVIMACLMLLRNF